jgi:hypothetical protein
MEQSIITFKEWIELNFNSAQLWDINTYGIEKDYFNYQQIADIYRLYKKDIHNLLPKKESVKNIMPYSSLKQKLVIQAFLRMVELITDEFLKEMSNV